MRKFGTFLASILIMAVIFVVPASTLAASKSLGVNPRRDYSIKSGDKVSDTVFVSNLSKTEDLKISIQLVDFGAQDETGSPKLLLEQKQPTRWSLKPYLAIADSVTILAGKSMEIPFTITIPKTVGAGSYYGAIKYSTAGAEADKNLSLASSSATLVFVRVPGEANDALLLNKFGAFTPDATGKDGAFGSLYVGSAPKYLAYRVTNKGNVAEQPAGSVQLKNMFGHQVKLFEKSNPNNNIVLIDQTRRIDLCLNEDRSSHKDAETGRNVETIKCNNFKLFPGRYTAQLGIVYGDNGSSSHELRAVSSFWYLPLWFIVAVFVGLFVMIALVIWISRRVSGRGTGYRTSNRK